VLDLSSYLAGPIGPAHLADLGADVVKIEPPAGEGCRMIMMLYLGGNTGKRGLALDIKSGAGKGVLIRLIEWSDVLVHNNRVGVAERLGIDYETVRRLRPDVIYLQSTAYGSEGPDAPLPGFDPLFQSLTGISAAQGGPGHPPVFPKTPICDISTAMLGAIAILLALRHRDLTGEGQLIETSLLATGLWLKSDAFVRHHGWSPPRLTNSDNTGLHAAYRSYRAQDGYLFIATRTEEQRRALGAATGVQDAIRAGEHGVDDDAITARISGAVVDRTVEEWLRTFERTGVPAAAVAEDNEEGVFGHPQVAHLGAVVSAEYPGYTSLQQPGVLIGFSESPGERRAGSPACGEHTVDVLEELGYSSDEIAELERAGAVAVYRDEED
jgi:crotonobetainyl-CoA:carnitine CoA-transferase CaiB-like acyl-CoA transferase